MNGPGGSLRHQARYELARLASIQPFELQSLRLIRSTSRFQQFFLTVGAGIQHATWRQNRLLTKTVRGRQEKLAAGSRQRPNLLAAIGFNEHGGRTTGGMVPRLGFL